MKKAATWNWKYVVKRNNDFGFWFSRMPSAKIKTPGKSFETQHFKSARIEKSLQHLDMLAKANPGIQFQIFTRNGIPAGFPLMYASTKRITMPLLGPVKA